MLTQDTIIELAQKLDDAERNRTQLRHFSAAHPEMTIEDGYAIQREWVNLKLAAGHRIKGRKIGLTSRAMQRSSQITEPDYAPLLDSMFFEGGGDIPISRFIAPRVEVELAFVLGRPLRGPNVTLFDVLDATEYVTPAIEIIDARIEQFDRETRVPRKVFDTISDFAANAGIVMGGRPVRPHEIDLRWVGALLYKNGAIEESGLAAAVLNQIIRRTVSHGLRTRSRPTMRRSAKATLCWRAPSQAPFPRLPGTRFTSTTAPSDPSHFASPN